MPLLILFKSWKHRCLERKLGLRTHLFTRAITSAMFINRSTGGNSGWWSIPVSPSVWSNPCLRIAAKFTRGPTATAAWRNDGVGEGAAAGWPRQSGSLFYVCSEKLELALHDSFFKLPHNRHRHTHRGRAWNYLNEILPIRNFLSCIVCQVPNSRASVTSRKRGEPFTLERENIGCKCR